MIMINSNYSSIQLYIVMKKRLRLHYINLAILKRDFSWLITVPCRGDGAFNKQQVSVTLLAKLLHLPVILDYFNTAIIALWLLMNLKTRKLTNLVI